jgi:hypothetical protein
MSEGHDYGRLPFRENNFGNSIDSIVLGFLIRAPQVREEEVCQAGQLLEGQTGGTIDLCLDLSRELDDPTLVLATMFAQRHPAMSDGWKNDPEQIRTVLSMSAAIEIGICNAERIWAESRRKAYLGAPKLRMLSEFIKDLQP